jgi:two-component system response regulator YesN
MRSLTMYKVLIVDDEIFAVKGVISGVNWRDLGITEIYEAYHAQGAKERLKSTPIDLVICDIEMPEENGIELVRWITTHFPDVVTVFLTCHADFSFAKMAIHLGSFDYLLKPAIYSDLEKVLRNALETIKVQRTLKLTAEQSKQYEQKWKNKKTELIEGFWRDLLAQRLLVKDSTFQDASEEYQLPFNRYTHILMILVSVEKWTEPFSVRDEGIMGFALRNAAEEMIIGDQDGHFIEDARGNKLILLYGDSQQTEYLERLKEKCKNYIQACNQYFYCALSCYLGEFVTFNDLMKSYHSLLNWEHKNVLQSNSVLLFQDSMERENSSTTSSGYMLDWTDWFERGDKEILYEMVDERLNTLSEQKVTIGILEELSHGFLQVIYYVLHRKGLHVQVLFKEGALSELSSVTKSIAGMGDWMKRMIDLVIGLITAQKPVNSIVQKIKEYIANHLHVEFSREDLAVYVFFNPAYISRLFRKETGLSLSDYILQERMKKASELLLETDQTVSHIASNLGYGNFSYFARMFKRVYGATPQEYRNR